MNSTSPIRCFASKTFTLFIYISTVFDALVLYLSFIVGDQINGPNIEQIEFCELFFSAYNFVLLY